MINFNRFIINKIDDYQKSYFSFNSALTWVLKSTLQRMDSFFKAIYFDFMSLYQLTNDKTISNIFAFSPINLLFPSFFCFLQLRPLTPNFGVVVSK